jgi:hypothetical protein
VSNEGIELSDLSQLPAAKKMRILLADADEDAHKSMLSHRI